MIELFKFKPLWFEKESNEIFNRFDSNMKQFIWSVIILARCLKRLASCFVDSNKRVLFIEMRNKSFNSYASRGMTIPRHRTRRYSSACEYAARTNGFAWSSSVATSPLRPTVLSTSSYHRRTGILSCWASSRPVSTIPRNIIRRIRAGGYVELDIWKEKRYPILIRLSF